MADIQNQIDEYDSKISSVEGKIQSMMDKIKSLSMDKTNKTGKQLEKNRKDQLELLKKIKILQKQLTDMTNTQLMMIINLGQDSQMLIDETETLQRNISADPEANPYFYSRKEKDPKYADIAKKRTSMRMRGKNPGPWTSDLMSQELRSLEIEDDAVDSTLAAVAKQMGQKKKKSKKPKKSMRRPKSRGKTRRNMSRRRRR